ncbi:MAG: aminoglycoside adenylyltransferase domain-containing protein [Anaerolineales bacterium]
MVATMCRARYTLTHSEVAGKEAAVAWALATFSEPWRSIVRRSRSWREDRSMDAAALIPEVMALVEWAATEGSENGEQGAVDSGEGTVDKLTGCSPAELA